MLASEILVSTPVLLTTATLLPAAVFALIMLVTRPYPRFSAGLSIAAVSVSALAILLLLIRHRSLDASLEYTVRWMASGPMTIPFGYLLDATSLLMLAVVVSICLLVQLYSLGYMAGDSGFARYYGFMSLFASAMMSLTVAATLLQLYVFWELVGLASYLLIGFWYEKFSASEAGKKAFVMTRLGDVAFFLGLLLLIIHFGNLDIIDLNGPALPARLSPAMAAGAAMLIFGGIIGKSAQFPLMTWLPDAMEGPTPVSALLHSATMVAAGVYLFARLFPFFSNSPGAMTFFLTIGTVSMLAAATMAMVSRDIKRVWAYSTISQLGYMIMALAAGGYFAGVFHLTAHAAFKALLFLCSGVFIHHFQTNDMFDIGRVGGRGLKIPMVCMILAGAALAGIPPMSGFFSKEAVIGAVADLGRPGWTAAALAGVFLTTYYTFRLIFIILFPQKTSDDGRHQPHRADDGAYRAMAVPLLILAAVSLVLGFFKGPLQRFAGGGAASEGQHTAILVTSLCLEAAALALAWFEFGRRGAPQKGFVERLPALRDFFAQRWYLDRCYRFALDVFVYRGVAAMCLRNDQQVIDGGIDGLSRATVRTARAVSWLHGAMIQHKLLFIFAVVMLMGVYVMW